VAAISHGCGDEDREQVLDLVAGQLDHPWRRRMPGVLGDRGHHQERIASMARVTQRYQERQRRTWCWSRPHSP
jgi:hypothetical protein